MSKKAKSLIFFCCLLLSLFFFFIYPDNTSAEKEEGVFSVNAGDTFFLNYDTKTPTVGGYVEPLSARFTMSTANGNNTVTGSIEAPEGKAYNSENGSLSVQSTGIRLRGIPIKLSNTEKDMRLRVVFPVPDKPELYQQKVHVHVEAQCIVPWLVKDKDGNHVKDEDGNLTFLDRQGTFKIPFDLRILPPGSIKTGGLRIDRVMGTLFLIIAIIALIRLGKALEKEEAESTGKS